MRAALVLVLLLLPLPTAAAQDWCALGLPFLGGVACQHDAAWTSPDGHRHVEQSTTLGPAAWCGWTPSTSGVPAVVVCSPSATYGLVLTCADDSCAYDRSLVVREGPSTLAAAGSRDRYESGRDACNAYVLVAGQDVESAYVPGDAACTALLPVPYGPRYGL